MDSESQLILNKSPLNQFFTDFDDSHPKWGYDEYWSHAKKQNYLEWNSLFLQEAYFRKQFGLNIIWSIEGKQGGGKSMALLRKKQIIDKVYGNPYSLEKFISEIHFFPDDLEEGISSSKNGSCNVLDEQIREHGIMTRFSEDQLANYEDTLRRVQKNIGYASPRLRRHEHFFIFKAHGDIFIDQTDTVGAVQVMMSTKREKDDLIVPRGILQFKAPEKNLWDAYNAKKDLFILKMQRKESGLMEKIEHHASMVIEKFSDQLYLERKDGTRTVVSKDAIELYMYKTLGMRAYTIKGYELVREEIKRKLTESI